MPELTVVVQIGQVHINNISAFSGVSRLEGFLNTGPVSRRRSLTRANAWPLLV